MSWTLPLRQSENHSSESMTPLEKMEVARLRVEEVLNLRRIVLETRGRMELVTGILKVIDTGLEIHRLITMSRKKISCDATE